ncbi:MAG: P-loop NTPase [Clostridia bacterium]|nr:P-loop NTPase [Clostridia bacterium]
MWDKKIIIISGHYGSGKTNIAVNLAEKLCLEGKKVALVDLDIVNPYFRAADNRKELEAIGVRCILPQFANTNVDIPSLPPQIHSVFSSDETVIFDVGGDKDGAVALGVYRNAINKVGYDMIAVVNMYRPLTATPEDTLENLREIENNCSLSFTGFINNSNLGRETTAEDVEASFAYAEAIETISKLPLLYTAHTENLTLSGSSARFPIRDITKKLYE